MRENTTRITPNTDTSRKAGEELTKSLEEFYLASNVNIRGIRE